MKIYKYIAAFILGAAFFGGIAYAQSIPSQSPFFYDSSNNITQIKVNNPIKITGLTPGGCLQLTSLNIATTTGLPCGSGSGGGGGAATTSFVGAYPVIVTPTSAAITTSLAFGTSTSNTWGGTQTFTNNPILGTLTGLLYGNSGVLASVATSTLTPSSPLTGSFVQVGTGGSIGCQTASGSQAGCLSSTDWNTFNGKGSGTVTAVTGTYPVQSSGGTAPAISLAFGTTTQNFWSAYNNFASLFATNASSTNATTTNLAIVGAAGNCNTTNALVTNSSGVVGCGAVPQGTVTSIATNNGITGGTITTSGTIGLATINAGVLGAAINGAVPTSQATSTLYGTGIGGQVLGWSNITGGLAFIATSSSGGTNFFSNSNNLTTLTTGTQLAVPTNGWFSQGTQLLAYASTTNQSTVFGLNAGGQDATTTSTNHENTAFGYGALQANSTGSTNTAIGRNALTLNSSGIFNTAVGSNALSSETTGSSNIAIGSSALPTLDLGSDNTAIGINSLNALTGITGVHNTAIGYKTGINVTTGYDNTFLGQTPNSGGNNLTTGGGNIGLGYNIVYPSTASNLTLNIGNGIFSTLPATTTSTTLPATITGVNFGIASSSPSFPFVANSALIPELIVATSSNTFLAATTTTQFDVRIGSSAIMLTLTAPYAGYKGVVQVCNPSNASGGAITWATSPTMQIHYTGGGSGNTAPTQTLTANVCEPWTIDFSMGSSTMYATIAQLTY